MKGGKVKSIPECTIFVGNLPTNTKLKQLRQFYKPYGEIQSLRFRSENGKKVLNKSDRKKYASLNAYVAFKNKESALKAIQTNGALFKECHVRCNLAVEKQEKFGQNLNTKSTVFVGNIPFEVTDEQLYEYFSTKCGAVDYVRRMPKKGIAFVCFKKGVPLIKALKLHDIDFEGRPLRIQKWESKDRIEKKAKKMKMKESNKKDNPHNKNQGNKRSNQSKNKLLMTPRHTNNPLIKKIQEKTKISNTVSKEDHKKKYRDAIIEGGGSKKHSNEAKKKKSEYHGVQIQHSKKKTMVQQKKKKFNEKKLKKISKILMAPVKTK